MAEVEELIFDGDSAVVCMYKKGYHFVKNPAHFVLKIDLLLTMLSNFEREATLAWYMLLYIQYLWRMVE